jgi:hypothetical protein
MYQRVLRVLVVMAALAILFFAPRRASAATCTWDNTANNWSSAAHWTGCGGSVPGASDVAVINGGTVTLDSAVTVQGLTLSGGTLTGNNDITITGTFQWDSGTLGGTGVANASGSMTMSGSGSRTLQDSRTVNNAGTLTWNSTGYVYMYTNTVFNNQVGATINVQANGAYLFYGSAGTLNNAGTITKSSSGDATIYTGVFNNTGTFNISGPGVMSVLSANPSAHSGPFQVSSNATLSFGGGTQSLNSGADISGAGTVNFASGTINIHSTYNVTGATTVSGGTTHFFSDATLTSLGALTISSGTLDLSSGETPSVGAFTMSNGTLSGSDNMSVNTFNWSAGTLGGFGTLTVNTTLSFTGSGSRTLQDSRVLSNAGTFSWNTTGYVYMYTNAVFNNLASANLNILANGTYLFYGSAGTVNNAGTITKSSSADGTIYTGSFNNTGAFKLTGPGVLSLSVANPSAHSGPFQISSNATLLFGGGSQDLNTGADISGAGTVNFGGGTVNIHSTYNITGTTSVSGGTTHFFSDATLISLGTLTISNGTLDLSSGETPSVGTFTMSNGTLNGSDNMSANAFTWNNGTLGGFGALTVNTTMGLAGSGSRTLQDSRTLNNAGTLTWNTTGYVYTNNNAIFNNQAGANFNIQTSSTYLFYGGAGTVNNAGTITKSGSGDTTLYTGAFNNTGTLKVTGPGVLALSVSSPSAHSGLFQVSANATLRFSYGNQDLNAGADVTGAGTIDFNSGTLNIHSTYNITGTTSVTGATVHFANDATLTSLGTLNISNGTLDLSSGETPTLNALTMSGGTVIGTDNFTIATFNWTGGTLGGSGATTVTGVTSATGTGSRALQDSRVFNNAGALTWNNTSYLYLYNTAVFNNQAGATFNAVNHGTYVFYGSAGTLNNAGTLNLKAGYVYVGHFTQAATGVTTFELDGTNPGSQYTQISATDVTLDGSAVVSYGLSFQAAFGNAFNLITYTTRTGTFSSVVLPSLDAGLAWNSVYGTTGWTVRVFMGLFLPVIIK